MAEMDAMNTLILGEQRALLEPLITADGNFTLGLRPEQMFVGELELIASTPSGETMTSAELNDMNGVLLEFGQAEAGVYRIAGTYDGADFSFAVSVYQQEEEDEDIMAYLVLAPSPTLANRGASEVFAYVFENGESVHGDYSLSRSMEGMQHSTDGDMVPLSHTHFDDAYDEALGETPMSNQTSLGFSMVGTWDVELRVEGEAEVEVIIFNVEMLEN